MYWSTPEVSSIHGEFETSSVEKFTDILKRHLVRRSEPFLAIQRVISLDMRMYEKRLAMCENAVGLFVPRFQTELNNQAIITVS